MENAHERLSHWRDPVFGELVWSEADSCWEAKIEFGDRAVSLSLYAEDGLVDPTKEEQLAAVRVAKALLPSLLAVEASLQREAALQVARADASQASDTVMPVDEFISSLALESVSLHGGGVLHYRSQRFFPRELITIYFNEDLSFHSAEIYEARPRSQ